MTHLTRRGLVVAAAVTTAACASDDRSLPRGAGPAPVPERLPIETRDTRTLLPYGTRFTFEDGTSAVLRRVAGPVLSLPSGEVGFTDPGWFKYTEPLEAARLPPGDHRTTLGVLDLPTTHPDRAPVFHAICLLTIGRTGRVREWRSAVDATGGAQFLAVDAGCAAAYHLPDLPVLADAVEPWDDFADRLLNESPVPVPIEGRNAAVATECPMGDGGYPVYVGHDADDVPVAVTVDLELHRHATAAT